MTSGLGLYILLGTDRHQSQVGYALRRLRIVLPYTTIASTERLFVSDGRSNKSEVWNFFLQKWQVTKSAATSAVKSWL